jgi:hypothetical protein
MPVDKVLLDRVAFLLKSWGNKMRKILPLSASLVGLLAITTPTPSSAEWSRVNNAAIRMALNDREVVFTDEGNQQIGGRQQWWGDGTTRTASGNVGMWIAKGGKYCSKRAGENEVLPKKWDCFDFAISTDGKKMRFGGGD